MLNVICLKHGTKYDPIYVNNLYNMIKRHLTVPHRFVCFTEDPRHVNPAIQIKVLPNNPSLSGWWWKPYIFKSDHFPAGDINLFIDLDMVIVRNIDNLIDYLPGKFVGLKDVSRALYPMNEKLCSAFMRWPSGQFDDIWSSIDASPDISKRFRGDQDWVWNLHNKSIKFFPDKWIVSYKWEVRSRDENVRINGRYNFNSIRNVELDPTTSVLAFHGTPNPHEVMDPIIVDNWR